MENKNDEMRITEEELKVIQATFGGNKALLKLMRKIFLPEYDPKAPLGQTVDLWTIQDIGKMPPEEVKIYFMTRRDLIMHVESALMQLQALSEIKGITPEALQERLKKNSNK